MSEAVQSAPKGQLLSAKPEVPKANAPTTAKPPSEALVTARLNAENSLKIAAINAESVAQTHYLDMWARIGSASAWPIAAVVLAIIFRNQFRKLIDKLNDFKGFGVEAKFREKVEDLAEQVADNAAASPGSAAAEGEEGAEGAEEPAQNPQAPQIESQSGFVGWLRGSEAERNLLLAVRPDVAITDGWLWIEHAALELGSRVGARTHHGNVSQLVRQLHTMGVIDGDMYEQILEARRLRNMIAHGRSHAITGSEAALYTQTAAVLASRLNAIGADYIAPVTTSGVGGIS